MQSKTLAQAIAMVAAVGATLFPLCAAQAQSRNEVPPPAVPPVAPAPAPAPASAPASAPAPASASASAADETAALARPLTLDEVWARADTAGPTLKARRAQLAAAEGVQADANALLYNNPQLSTDQTRRSVGGSASDRRHEWSAGISQTLEIAGQPGYRREAAAAALAALRAEIDDTRRAARAAASEHFYRVLAWQQRVALEVEAVRLFDDTAEAIQKRREAGEDTRLDANVATVEAERARNQLALAQEQLLDARSALATTLQLPPASLPQVVGELALPTQRHTFEALMAAADAQPRLRALQQREDSASARLKLEQASAYPDVTVGVNVGREGPGRARERLTTFTVSVPLPLFKHNASGIGQARTELSQTQIEREAALRDSRAAVSALWLKLNSLEARVQRLQSSVLPTLAANQQLSVKSQRAGQIGLLELIVVNRQALDARRDLNDALSDFHATRLALDAAAGYSFEGTQP